MASTNTHTHTHARIPYVSASVSLCECVVYRVHWHAIKTKLVGLCGVRTAKDFRGQTRTATGGCRGVCEGSGGRAGTCSMQFYSFLIELFSSKSFN